MQRFSHPDAGDRPASMMRRTSSVSSDRMSMSLVSSMAAPPPVSPEPAFIAASAASQIVTSDHQSQMDAWFGEEDEHTEATAATIVPAALAHINSFLDQLLYAMLATARSTSIAALRPAVSEVLKPRLAKDAINGADEELQDFASGREDEGLAALDSGTDFVGMGDLNLIWRRTRLRCMVYTRLGDLEEEDEEAYIEREHQEDAENRDPRSSEDLSVQDLGLVSPPSAIFLTSILEFIGEQSLLIAGDAAYTRFHNRPAGARRDSGERVLVEEADVEKIAFDTRLGRLWRSWKKKIRSPGMMSPRLLSRESFRGHPASSSASNPTSRKASLSEVDEPDHRPNFGSRRSVEQVMEEPAETFDEAPEPHDIPLPQSPVQYGPGPSAGQGSRRRDPNRPSSMIEYAPARAIHSGAEEQVDGKLARGLHHQRSLSMPTPSTSSFSTPVQEDFHTPRAMSESSDLTEPAAKPIQEAEHRLDDEGSAAKTVKQDVNDAEGRHSAAVIHAGTRSGTVHDDIHHGGKTPTLSTSGMSKADFDRQLQAIEHEIRHPSEHRDDLSTVETEEAHPEVGIPSPRSMENDHDLPHGTNLSRSNIELGMPSAQMDDDLEEHKGEDRPQHGDDENPAMSTQGGMRPQQSIPKPAHIHVIGTPLNGQAPDKEVTTNNIDSYEDHDASNPDSYVLENSKVYEKPPVRLHVENGYEKWQRPAGDHSESGVEAAKSQDGAPPLTPLRELMEAAPDTSDEASSLALSQDISRDESHPSNRHPNGDAAGMGSSALPIFSNVEPASQSSNAIRRVSPAAISTERAAVQRVVPASPLSAREPTSPFGRTSTSSNRELRAVQTSSSSASQKAKGLAGRESGEAPRRPLVSRKSSEGSNGHLSGKRSMTLSRSGDPPLDFDQLIKSDETVKYTLTPQSMRDMEVNVLIALPPRLLC